MMSSAEMEAAAVRVRIHGLNDEADRDNLLIGILLTIADALVRIEDNLHNAGRGI